MHSQSRAQLIFLALFEASVEDKKGARKVGRCWGV